MCLPAPRPSKASRQSSSSAPQQVCPKHLKCHPNADMDLHSVGSSTTASSTRSSFRRHNKSDKKSVPKTVSFNEVVMIRPHFRRPKKSVSFHEVVIVRPVLHLTDFTDQEIIDSWYILADKQRIKSEILTTLRNYKESMNPNGSSSSLQMNAEICVRGLEKLADGGRARERRRISIREIIQEQESQRALYAETKQEGPFLYDTSKFRKTYKHFSRAARHLAHAVAKMDELAATTSEKESV